VPPPPTFDDLFGAPADVAADAPGRVNLIGEHTDYHEGYVLPIVIPQRTRAAARRRDDATVRVWSAVAPERIEEYRLGAERSGRGWLDYVQGLSAALARRGMQLAGSDLRIESTVPVGAGVSSSAALEVSVLRALRQLFHLDLDDVALARAAQAAETDFVGAPVGIMDQMAASLGQDGEALFLDSRTLAFKRIPLPRSIDLIAIDSGVPHQHAGGEYVTRRKESFEAARRLGVGHLRDVSTNRLQEVDALPPTLAKRARHVITENQRVLDAVDALAAEDATRLGAILNASHVSMRDHYEMSTPEVDRLVDLAQRHPDVYGARLTGGGFGGAVVMIARRNTARRAAPQIAEAYGSATGKTATVLVPPTPDERNGT